MEGGGCGRADGWWKSERTEDEATERERRGRGNQWGKEALVSFVCAHGFTLRVCVRAHGRALARAYVCLCVCVVRLERERGGG